MNNSTTGNKKVQYTENEFLELESDEDYNVNPELDEQLELVIPNDCAGLRLDQALARLLPEYSRSRLQSWINEGCVHLDGQIPNNKQKVWGEEQVVITPQLHPSEQSFTAEDIPLDIVYEDDCLLVVNKPVGLVVHPGSGNWHGTLLNALLHHCPELKQVPRAGIVHRLDKDTSGLLVVAKTLTAQTHLVRQLQARTVKREYLALVYGEIDFDGVINEPIGRHPSQRTRMAVIMNGKPAVTRFRVEENFPSCTLLRCSLETGRTHQIRVHLSHNKHPLVGDQVYTKGPQSCIPELRELLREFPRQALHATRLGLIHPETEEHMEWSVDVPEDMETLLSELADFCDGLDE